MLCWLKEHHRSLVILLGLGLVVRSLSAYLMQRPGYMDAAYYVDGALSLYEGRGFNDPFIWNYLDDPAGIPHPSHLYWMPLSSILAYLSFLLFGPSYRAAQVPFALLSSLLPLLSYLVAYDVAHDRRHALCAGLFATFSGFYVAYWVTPDSFAPFALAGALCLWAVGRGLEGSGAPSTGRWPFGERRAEGSCEAASSSGSAAPGAARARRRALRRTLWAKPQANPLGPLTWFAIAGISAGFAHLARADGLLLVGVALLMGALWIVRLPRTESRPRNTHHRLTRGRTQIAQIGICYTAFAICYLLVMGPWYVRNMRVLGRPLATAGMQTIWLASYDDLYSYGKPLVAQSYLAWGWENILRSKWKALWLNAQTLLFVGWAIFMVPWGLIGVCRLRRRTVFGVAWLYGACLYLAMSLVFTFPGWRGGMLHSTTALLPFLYAAALEGLDAFVVWVSRFRRTWRPRQAQRILSAGLVGFAILLSAALYIRGLGRFTGGHLYGEVSAWMNEYVPSTARVMVNDPASFYYHSRRQCLSIPNADLETVLEVMDRYDTEYLLLDSNYVLLRPLYDSPQSDERLLLLRAFAQGEQPIYLLKRVKPSVAGVPTCSLWKLLPPRGAEG